MSNQVEEERPAPPPLIPPDFDRCQGESMPGSFMTLGPRKLQRCKAVPVWIVVEIKPGSDGRCGSMSLCHECAKIMLDRDDIRPRVQLQPIERGRLTANPEEQ